MKTTIRPLQTFVLTLAVTVLLAAPAAYAQQKGAEKLIQLKPGVSATPAAAAAPAVMKCPTCRDTTKQVAELSFKGTSHGQLRVVPVHECPSCATKIATVGHGKATMNVVNHTCQASGGDSAACCAKK